LTFRTWLSRPARRRLSVGSDRTATWTVQAAAHPVVRATLEEAGWSPGYRFDASKWARVLNADGYSVTAPAVEAMEELGGLTIVPPRRDTAAYGSGTMIMDPVFAAIGESPRIKLREEALGRRLCPIGEWSNEYIVLVAEDGSVFAETTFQVVRLGNDLAEALHRMIVADTIPEEIK
jgi:hypothetical protein